MQFLHEPANITSYENGLGYYNVSSIRLTCILESIKAEKKNIKIMNKIKQN